MNNLYKLVNIHRFLYPNKNQQNRNQQNQLQNTNITQSNFVRSSGNLKVLIPKMFLISFEVK